MPASVVTFWSKVLEERAQRFNSGDLEAEPPIENGRHSGPSRGGSFPPDPGLSDFFDADWGRARFCSGFTFLADVRRQWNGRGESGGFPAGDGWQAADLQYYSSGAVYTLLTFYQMWPVKVDNQDATLVWRIDMISAERLGELRGVERLVSGAAMMREIQKSVKAFPRDSSRG